MSQPLSRDNHTKIPARGDLTRLGIGIIGIGTSGPLIAISAMAVPALIFWRNLGGSLMTLPFALRHKVDRTGVKWAVVSGVLLSFHFYGFFLSMRMTSVAAGTALVALQPIFAALFMKFSGGDIPSRAWLGMFVSFTGVILVSGFDLQISMRAFIGDLLAIASGALSALYVITGAKSQRTLETTSYASICYFVCAMTALPFVVIGGFQLFSFEAREWLILLALILGAQLLGHSMFNSVLKRVSPAIVSMIVFFEVPVAALLAVWWMDQKPPVGVIPGIILILGGCALVVLRTRTSKELVE
jgi:drug/metabolite transporter (DMT)-like permease